jgi:hypothetical protein
MLRKSRIREKIALQTSICAFGTEEFQRNFAENKNGGKEVQHSGAVFAVTQSTAAPLAHLRHRPPSQPHSLRAFAPAARPVSVICYLLLMVSSFDLDERKESSSRENAAARGGD